MISVCPTQFCRLFRLQLSLRLRLLRGDFILPIALAQLKHRLPIGGIA